MAILVITFDCNCHDGGWINIATLNGSESVLLSDHDLNHTLYIIYIIYHHSLIDHIPPETVIPLSRSTALATAAAGPTHWNPRRQ